jgi:hypothetical protein
MMAESLGWLAGLLLLASAVAGFLVLFSVEAPWKLIGFGAKIAAVLVLVVAMVLVRSLSWQGQPSWPHGFLHPAWCLALATLVVDLVFAWRIGADAASPFVDLVSGFLVLGGTLSVQSGAPAIEPAGIGTMNTFESVLITLGFGALVVAGGAGLALGLRRFLKERTDRLRWTRWLSLHLFLKHSLALASVVLGAGLLVGMWLSWQTTGLLLGSSAHEGWAAGAALTAAMGLVARRMGKWWGPWTAGLAVLAALMAISGMLAMTDVSSILGAWL